MSTGDFFKYPVSPLGFDLMRAGECELGWAIKFDREAFSAVTWQTAVLMRWQKAGCFKQFTKAHIKYVFNTLSVQGIHLYDGDHPFLYDWDFCPSPNGHCDVCDELYVIANSFQVGKYGARMQV
jgi:hypothetical protein